MQWFGINISSILQAIKIDTRSFLIKVFVLSTICVVLYIPIYSRVLEQHINAKDIIVYEDSNDTDNFLDSWSEDTDRDPMNYLYPNTDTTIRQPKEFGDDIKDKTEYFVLVIVCSALDNFEKRNSIRDTWGNYEKYFEMTDMFAKVKEKFADYHNGIEFNNKLGDIFQDKLEVLENQEVPDDYEKCDIVSKTNYTKPTQEKLDYKLLFLLGLPIDDDIEIKKQIDEEITKYDDIVQEDFIDSYTNLSIKSIFMLKWIKNKVHNKVRYILKSDDDSYINLPVLIETLSKRSKIFDENTNSWTRNKKEYVLIGDLYMSSPPNRNVSSKWYCPYYMFKGDKYPNYLSGTGYVMSLPAAHALYDAALKTEIFHVEDIYITGICSERADPPLIPENDRIFYNEVYSNCGICCAYSHIIVHHMTPRYMWTYNNYLLNSKILERCEKFRQNLIVENKASMYIICTIINPKDPECLKDVLYWNS